MAKILRGKDHVEQEFFMSLIKSGKEAIVVLKEVGGIMKTGLKADAKEIRLISPKSVQDIDNFNKKLGETKIKLTELQKIEKKTADTEKQLAVLRTKEGKKQILQFEKLRQEKLAITKTTREQVRDERALDKEYERQSRLLTKLIKRYQNLAAATDKETQEMRDLLAVITPLDTRLKQIDKTVGRGGRTVGLYASELAGLTVELKKAEVKAQDISVKFGRTSNQFKTASKTVNNYRKDIVKLNNSTKIIDKSTRNYGASLKNLLGTLGIFLGIQQAFRLLKDTIGIVRDFESSMETLAGVFRTTREDLKPVEDEIRRVGSTSVRSATETADLAESLATLGKSREEIIKLLQPVTRLSIGLKVSSDEAGEFLVQMLNTFGASSEEAEEYADVIASIRTSTSLDFQKMRDSFQFLAPISRVLNKDLAFTGALVGILADNGIKAQRAGRLLGSAQQKLAVEGKTLTEALEEVNKAQEKGVKEADLLAIATGLFGVQAAGLGVILANNSDIIETNAQAIRDNGGALDDLVNTQLKSLDSQLKILSSAWTDYILNVDESSGATSGLTKLVTFLSKNLRAIINTVVALVGAFLSYKLVLISINAVQKVATALNIAYRISVIALNGGFRKAILGIKAFRIVLASTGVGLFVIAIGVLVATFIKLNKSVSETAEELHKSSEEFIENAKESRKLNDELNTMSERYDELTGKAELNKEEQAELNDIIKNIAKNVPDAVIEVDKYGNALVINTKKVKDFNKENNKLSKLKAIKNIQIQTKNLNLLKETYRQLSNAIDVNNSKTDDFIIKGLGPVKRINGQITKYNGLINERTKLTLDEQIIFESFRRTLEGNISVTEIDIEKNRDLIKSIIGVTDSKNEETKAIKSNTEVKKKAEELTQLKKLEKQLKETNEARELVLKSPEDSITPKFVNLTRKAEKLKEEIRLLKQELEFDPKLEIEELKELETEEERIKKEEKALEKSAKLASESARRRVRIIEEEEAEIERLRVENVKRFEFISKVTADLEEERHQRKLERIDEEIEKSKIRSNTIRKLAVEGNLQAQQSLAIAEKQEDQLRAKKEKAIQKQKQVELGLAILQTYTIALGKEGATPGSALKEATLTSAGLLALVSALPSFFEGTEDTGTVSNPLDSKGGRLAVIHDNERYVPKKINKHLEGISNSELPIMASFYREALIQPKVVTTNGNWQSNQEILSKFDELNDNFKNLAAITKENKPFHTTYDYNNIEDTLTAIIERGNLTRRDTKKISRLWQ